CRSRGTAVRSLRYDQSVQLLAYVPFPLRGSNVDLVCNLMQRVGRERIGSADNDQLGAESTMHERAKDELSIPNKRKVTSDVCFRLLAETGRSALRHIKYNGWPTVSRRTQRCMSQISLCDYRCGG